MPSTPQDVAQVAQTANQTGPDVMQYVTGLLGGLVVWLGNQFVQTAIKERLDKQALAIEKLNETLTAFRAESSERDAKLRERLAALEAVKE